MHSPTAWAPLLIIARYVARPRYDTSCPSTPTAFGDERSVTTQARLLTRSRRFISQHSHRFITGVPLIRPKRSRIITSRREAKEDQVLAGRRRSPVERNGSRRRNRGQSQPRWRRGSPWGRVDQWPQSLYILALTFFQPLQSPTFSFHLPS